MAETGTASVITPSVSTAVTYALAPVAEICSSVQVFNGLSGFHVSDPLVLSGDPVTGSVVRWTANTPAGSSATFETSINNGASWDTATDNSPVPRLRSGDTVTRSVLTRVTLTRAAPADPPPTVSSLEIQVSCDTGVDELVPLAHGIIDKVTVKSASGSSSGGSSSGGSGSGVASHGGGQTGGGTSIKVHGVDLSRAIKRNAWQQPFYVPGGTNYADAARSMVADRLPSQTEFNLSSTEHVTPLLVFGLDQGGDPWQDIADMATAIGFECFFDPAGVFVFRPVPDPRRGEPVWVFGPDPTPTVTDAKRELTDEQTFNYVVVKGESTSTRNPVAASAFDDDPSSPTYVDGPYGTVTQRLTFPLVTTQEQAQDVADAILLNSLGAADTVTISCVPMPALEPGDIVEVDVPNTKAAGTYMVNQVLTPLSPAEAQQLTCFRQSRNT
jgi:hypothetical protein